MRIVCVSDTHAQHRSLRIPEGDLLIHAGDITYSGEEHVVLDFLKWFEAQPHKHKLFVAGNHDFCFENRSFNSANYLNDSGVVIDGFNVYGSPITPTFGHWAFMQDRGIAIRNTWSKIPKNTDILITHGPPLGILDITPRGDAVGCRDLLYHVNAIKPKLHVFGHIHNGYGKLEQDGTIFVNASSCNEEYDAVNEPIVVDIANPQPQRNEG